MKKSSSVELQTVAIIFVGSKKNFILGFLR